MEQNQTMNQYLHDEGNYYEGDNTHVINRILAKTFAWMFLGLFVTGISSTLSYSSGLTVDIIFDGSFNLVMLLQLAVVLGFSFLFRKLSPTVVAVLYFVYALLTGVSVSVIFYVYELSSIYSVFFLTAGLFGGLAAVGYFTKADLTKWGPYILMGLIGTLVLSLLNIFVFKAEGLGFIIDLIVIVVFMAATIYDVNKIKMMATDPTLDHSKIHIYGAMQLYLDFINLFLRLLAVLGKRK